MTTKKVAGKAKAEKKEIVDDKYLKDVQPIRDLQKLEDMKWALKRHCSERDYIMFLIGINTGLRVGDLLKLKTNQVKGKKEIIIQEGKTKKKRKIKFTAVYDELQEYIKTNNSEWLFPSRKGDSAITPKHAHRALNKAAEFAGVESVGTHTMRKTFGYWFYKRNLDVAKLQSILNHSHPQITLTYIGINQEEIDNSLDTFSL